MREDWNRITQPTSPGEHSHPTAEGDVVAAVEDPTLLMRLDFALWDLGLTAFVLAPLAAALLLAAAPATVAGGLLRER